MRGEVDFVAFIRKEDYGVVKNDASFKAYAIPADYYYALVYNLNDPILADKKIREAIAYGVDRKSLIGRTGYGLECQGPFYPNSLGFNPQVKPFEYNPQKSSRLLEEAGWQDKDNDGILEKEGEELELRILVDARSDVYKKIAMVIRQQLQEIGIKIKVILYDDDSQLSQEFLRQRNPQAHLKLLLGGINPDQQAEDWCFKEFKGSDKLWSYKNEEVDKLFELGKITKGKEKRGKIYRKIHQLIYQDQPACFLYFRYDFHVVSSKFENVDNFFNLTMPFYTMKDWHLSDKRRQRTDNR